MLRNKCLHTILIVDNWGARGPGFESQTGLQVLAGLNCFVALF